MSNIEIAEWINEYQYIQVICPLLTLIDHKKVAEVDKCINEILNETLSMCIEK